MNQPFKIELKWMGTLNEWRRKGFYENGKNEEGLFFGNLSVGTCSFGGEKSNLQLSTDSDSDCPDSWDGPLTIEHTDGACVAVEQDRDTSSDREARPPMHLDLFISDTEPSDFEGFEGSDFEEDDWTVSCGFVFDSLDLIT